MSKYLGDFIEDATVYIPFTTNAADGGRESFSASLEEADVVILKNGAAMTLDASTITISLDLNSRVGFHVVAVDMSNDADFTTGADYAAVLYPSDETLDSQAPVGVLACWSCENRYTASIYSQTTVIESNSIVIESNSIVIESSVQVVESDVQQVYSDTTIIASDLVVVYSDTTAIHSDTTIVASDVVQVYSDTTAIHSQTTVIESDSIVVESSVQVTESDVQQVYSDTTIIASDLLLVYSDTTAVHSDTTIIASDVVLIYSDTTSIHSDTTIIASDVVILDSSITVIQSDVALIETARTEPGQGAPGVSVSPLVKLDYLYKAWRNKSEQDSDDYNLYAADATTIDQNATCSDDGTTFTRGEVGTGA